MQYRMIDQAQLQAPMHQPRAGANDQKVRS
jgi:hypothetical protein